MIDAKATFLEALRQHFRDEEIRPADVLKAVQTNQALGVALIAVIARPNVLRIGKLFARLRDKGWGDHILEGSIDLHTKSWVYTVSPWALPKPKADPIKAAEADLAAALELTPLEQMTAAEAAKVLAGSGTRILQRVETEKEREVARAQRALDRAKIAQDPEALELIKRNKEQRRAIQRHGGIHDLPEVQSGNPGWSLPTAKRENQLVTTYQLTKSESAPSKEVRHGAGDPAVKRVLIVRPGSNRREWVLLSEMPEGAQHAILNTPGSDAFRGPYGPVYGDNASDRQSASVDKFGWPTDSI